MSSLILPSRRIVQPAGLVEVDWSNPLTRNLAASYEAQHSKFLQDVAHKNHATSISGLTAQLKPSQVGRAVEMQYVLDQSVAGLVAPYSPLFGSNDGGYGAEGSTNYTVYAVLEFSVLSGNSSYEHMVIRAAGAMGQGFALDYFPLYRTIRPLLATSSTSGWTTGNDISDPRMEDGIPWVFGFTWSSGRFLKVFSGPLGGEARIWERPVVPGGTYAPAGSYALYLGGSEYTGNTTGHGGISLYSARIMRASLTDGQMAALVSNPQQIFKPVTRRIYFDVGGSSTTVALDGAALAVATASGTLTTGIPLSGVAVSTSAASGGLTAQITLSGSALAQAVSSALLSSGITMTAAAVVQAAASGTLVTAIQMIGAAQAQSGASGSLTTGSGGLEGSAQASASASASLSAQIRLSGTAIANAAASGSLSGSANLAGAAVSTTSASGELTVNIALTAQALASAIATGSLTAQILLDADAAAQAQAGADLSGGSALVTPDVVQIISAPAGRQHRPGYLYGHRHGIKIGS